MGVKRFFAKRKPLTSMKKFSYYSLSGILSLFIITKVVSGTKVPKYSFKGLESNNSGLRKDINKFNDLGLPIKIDIKQGKKVVLPGWTKPLLVWIRPKIKDQIEKFDHNDQKWLVNDLEKQSREVPLDNETILLKDILNEYKKK